LRPGVEVAAPGGTVAVMVGDAAGVPVRPGVPVTARVPVRTGVVAVTVRVGLTVVAAATVPVGTAVGDATAVGEAGVVGVAGGRVGTTGVGDVAGARTWGNPPPGRQPAVRSAAMPMLARRGRFISVSVVRGAPVLPKV
jgi:hypothetical protein